jgi:hypothetical protein
MNKIKQLLVIFFIAVLFDFVFFKLGLANSNKDSAIVNTFYQITMFGLSLVFFLTLFYRTLFTLKGSIWATVPSLILCFSLAGFVSGRLNSLMLAYEKTFTKKSHITVDEHLQRFDSRMLWRGNSNAKGFYHYNLGDTLVGKVEVIYDSLGHKSVPDSLRVMSDTLDMIIGCSFSYGSFVKGQDGYPYLVTKAINHRFMNASMGGYGLAQMQMRLDSLLPAHKFKYVFIQMAPWLSERAMSISGIFARGYPSVHYFAMSDSGLRLMPQAYESPDYNKLGDWYTRGRNYSERIHYFFTAGYILQVKGYVKMLTAQFKIALGLIPGPIKDKLALEKMFYDKAISDVRKSGAIPILVKFYWNDGSFEPLREHLKDKALIIDCDRRLDSVSQAMGVSPLKLYRLYVEKDGKKLYYDIHPNEFANRLIAEEILSRIKVAR